MTPELEARRAVACRGWRWMQGMLIADNGAGVRYLWSDADYLHGMAAETDGLWVRMRRDRDRLPDLTDSATLGCLLALVREAYGSEALYVRLSDTRRKSDGLLGWEVLGWLDPSRSPDERGGSFRGWGYASEAEALVAALEAAP